MTKQEARLIQKTSYYAWRQLGKEVNKLKMIILFHTLFGKFLNYLVEKLDNLIESKI